MISNSMATRLGAAMSMAVVLTTGCGTTELRQKAEATVIEFHQRLNEARFVEIYSNATAAFQASGPQADFEAILGGVRRKLGTFKNAQLRQWRVTKATNGTFVELQYESQFDEDIALEAFTFLILNDEAVLQGYNINSITLVTK